jgi:hypothetical protein
LLDGGILAEIGVDEFGGFGAGDGDMIPMVLMGEALTRRLDCRRNDPCFIPSGITNLIKILQIIAYLQFRNKPSYIAWRKIMQIFTLFNI